MTTKNTADAFVRQELAQGKKANRLRHEQSPYLLQHAFNPVDWHPWGEEAFARARAEDKPIFLSIGYSTCHWCHVMARESFADPEAAAILNRDFIAVKVDREERPDVDHLYMGAAQAMNGSSGWPLSVFLTPERQPFYAGTYFPPEPRHGLPGFRQLLAFLSGIWQEQRDKVLQSAAAVTEHLRTASQSPQGGVLEEDIAARAFSLAGRDFDPQHGGFGPAPKFPRPVLFNFLLHHHHWTGEAAALEMTLFSLRRMAAGGVYDQVGGGFHRYSVDAQWRVPHFEKMLYDQAQLAQVYLTAFQLSQERLFAEVAEDILAYVLRDLRDPQGGFYSAEDADSPAPDNPALHGEGLFYLWSEAEIMGLLGPESGRLFCRRHGVRREGNALEDPQGEFRGKNILYLAESLAEIAAATGLAESRVQEALAQGRQRLFAARSLRPRPHLDDKVVTSSNALMISALVRAFQVLGREKYLAAAQKAARFLRATLYEEASGTLRRRYRAGQAGLPGQLADYAFFCQALLDLHQATFVPEWLDLAEALSKRQVALFHDEKGGGFFDAAAGDGSLLLRLKSDYDGAEPAGNSVAALNLHRLARCTGRRHWQEMAAATVAAFAQRLNAYPPILPQMLVAHGCAQQPPAQIVIAGTLEEEETQRLLAVVRNRFLPEALVLLADGGPGQERLARGLPVLAGMGRVHNRPAAYLCKEFRCQRPTGDPAELAAALDARGKGGA
jgi:uncharacterized protein